MSQGRAARSSVSPLLEAEVRWARRWQSHPRLHLLPHHLHGGQRPLLPHDAAADRPAKSSTLYFRLLVVQLRCHHRPQIPLPQPQRGPLRLRRPAVAALQPEHLRSQSGAVRGRGFSHLSVPPPLQRASASLPAPP